jgi:hypothetical protein
MGTLFLSHPGGAGLKALTEGVSQSRAEVVGWKVRTDVLLLSRTPRITQTFLAGFS